MPDRREGEAAPAGPREPCSILVVGEDRLSAELMPPCLRSAGYATVLASCGAEALAHAERTRPRCSFWIPRCRASTGRPWPVWPYDHADHRRILDVHMCNLRGKLNRVGPPLIHTMHGIGYVLRNPHAGKR